MDPRPRCVQKEEEQFHSTARGNTPVHDLCQGKPHASAFTLQKQQLS